MKRILQLIFIAATFITTNQMLKAQTAPAKVWDKTFGSNNGDELNSLNQTSDGGFILGGYARAGISGDKSQASKGYEDYWIVKVNASGNKQWDKTFGGSNADWLRSSI